MESSVYNQEGKKVGTVKLPESVFGVKWNGDLVHQVVVSMQANARPHVAHVKDRGEVAGGGKKPWRQKGTGRARHGSIRSPLWVGGGVTHGPNADKIFARKINRKMRAKALYSSLSRKYKEGEILFVDKLSIPSGKTKDAKAMLSNFAAIKGFEHLTTKPAHAALVVFPQKDSRTFLGLRNFSNIAVDEVRNLNPVSVLSYKYLVIGDPQVSCELLSKRMLTSNA
jgi:large subunit ribosomal protein L4